MHLKELKNLIKGKKIAIVGPSPSLVNAGKTIDKYDIVIRIKKGFPIPKKMCDDIGQKTDIIYTNLRLDNGTNNLNDKTIKSFFKEGGKAICYPYPIGKGNFNYSCDRFTQNYLSFPHRNNVLVSVEDPFWKKVTRELDARPTIGMIAMADVVRYLPSELYITGFTFRVDSKAHPLYRNSYKNAKQTKYAMHTMTTVHDPIKELKYLINLMDRYPIIKLDKTLEKIVNQRMGSWTKEMQKVVYQYWKREKEISDKIKEHLKELALKEAARKKIPIQKVPRKKKPVFKNKKTKPIISVLIPQKIVATKKIPSKKVPRKKKPIYKSPIVPVPVPVPVPVAIHATPNIPIKPVIKPESMKWKKIVLLQSSITKRFRFG